MVIAKTITAVGGKQASLLLFILLLYTTVHQTQAKTTALSVDAHEMVLEKNETPPATSARRLGLGGAHSIRKQHESSSSVSGNDGSILTLWHQIAYGGQNGGAHRRRLFNEDGTIAVNGASTSTFSLATYDSTDTSGTTQIYRMLSDPIDAGTTITCVFSCSDSSTFHFHIKYGSIFASLLDGDSNNGAGCPRTLSSTTSTAQTGYVMVAVTVGTLTDGSVACTSSPTTPVPTPGPTPVPTPAPTPASPTSTSAPTSGCGFAASFLHNALDQFRHWWV